MVIITDATSLRRTLEQAYSEFSQRSAAVGSSDGYPLPYAICDQVESGSWTMLADQMVTGELRDTINHLNSWSRRLMDWSAWMTVLEKYQSHDEWTVRDHFIEPLVFSCMFEPSSTRDRFGMIATHAIHQANLCMFSDYLDTLDQDANPSRPLSRKKAEKQIRRWGKKWEHGGAFLDKLSKLDSPQYRISTRNFRNLASHAIPPRYEFGHTRLVVRTVGPKTKLVEQADSSFREISDGEETVASYSFGGTPPLSLKEMYALNSDEFGIARGVLHEYQLLLGELLNAIGPRQ